MRLKSVLACLMWCAITVGCRSQDVVSEIANSHIERNVPKGKLFDEYLNRDLKSYFCGDAKNCKVEYELFRDAPTQTGIAYPKFYVWAKCFKEDAIVIEGAVRVAAVDQKRFEVTHFLSRAKILVSTLGTASAFPAPLVEEITQKARGNESHDTKSGARTLQ
jgi:hypothetical protein